MKSRKGLALLLASVSLIGCATKADRIYMPQEYKGQIKDTGIEVGVVEYSNSRHIRLDKDGKYITAHDSTNDGRLNFTEIFSNIDEKDVTNILHQYENPEVLAEIYKDVKMKKRFKINFSP